MEPTSLPRGERLPDGGDARFAPRSTAGALDHALARLATTIDALVEHDDLDVEARVLGETRRTVIVTLVGHLDRVVVRLHLRGDRGDRVRTDPADASAVAGHGEAAAAALGVRRQRLAEALAHAVERALPDEADLVDELDALLARVELAHVALDAGYELCDLPPASIAACARVSAAFSQLRSTLPAEPRIRSVVRRRGGMPWPRGRRSS